MIRGDFISYLASEGYSEGYKGNLLRSLDKYFTMISSPTDIMRCFAKVEKGKKILTKCPSEPTNIKIIASILLETGGFFR